MSTQEAPVSLLGVLRCQEMLNGVGQQLHLLHQELELYHQEGDYQEDSTLAPQPRRLFSRGARHRWKHQFGEALACVGQIRELLVQRRIVRERRRLQQAAVADADADADAGQGEEVQEMEVDAAAPSQGRGDEVPQ